MTLLGIELNDAAITLVDDSAVQYSEPGYALSIDGRMLFGIDAWKLARLHPQRTQNRFWRELSEKSLTKPVGPHTSSADLAQAQLHELWDRCSQGTQGVVLAVPAYWSPEQLGLLLGIAQELKIPVKGLVDSAVAAIRREYIGRDLLYLDASLHDMTVTCIDQREGASVGTRQVIDQIGVERLERTCVEFIARQFLKDTRFDPLHHADSEQFIYDNLYGWLAQLNRQTELPLTVQFRGNEFDSVLNAAELKNRIGDFCEPAIQQLRTLLSAERPAAIQLGGRLADFPGFVEALGRLPRVAAVVQEQAAAGRGALRRAGSIKESESGYRLTTTVAWDQAAVDLDASVQSSTPVGNREQRPTHVLVNGLAYQLGARAFHIGAELSSGDYGAPLDGRMTGVSRRHCTISVEDQGVVVSDHSRYGTRLNGHRIDGSAFLQVGDVLSLGDPAREFLLITEVIPDGT